MASFKESLASFPDFFCTKVFSARILNFFAIDICIKVVKATYQMFFFSNAGGRPPSAIRSGGNSGSGSSGRGGYPASNQGNEMNIPNDGGSDSLSSTSEAEAAAANTGEIGDNGKPLSFARIASLNLEKQAIGQKPPKNAGEGVMVPSSGSGTEYLICSRLCLL